MKSFAAALLLLTALGCKKKGLETVVRGTRFEEAALLEKGKVTILEFGADW